MYEVAQTALPDQAELVSADQSASDSEDTEQHGFRKRRRPMNVTCEACKQRKVKCDRAQPSCGWCMKNDHVCEYRERKKPGLRAGYGRELESRLDKLEAIINEQGRQLAAHLQGAYTMSSTTTESISNSTAAENVASSTLNPFEFCYATKETSQGQAIDPKLQHPPPNERHDPLYAAIASSDHSFQKDENDATSSLRSQPLTSPHATATFQQASPAYSEVVIPLPPYDLLYSLVDLYFKHVNGWIPLLDRKTTMDTLFGQSPLGEADRVLLHAIVATSLRYSNDSRLTAESKQNYHTTSKQKVQLFGIENSSVRSLQALVILAIDVTGTTNGPPGWNMLSLISRSIVQLGLAAETTSSLSAPLYPSIATLRAAVLPEPKTYIEDEERRRLFWSVFLLDRYATVATAFDFALNERDIDRRLPCRDDLFNANRSAETRWFRRGDDDQHDAVLAEPHGHFAYHCELLGILGRIHQFLKGQIDIGSLNDVKNWQNSYRALDGELHSWHFNLPDDFINVTRLLTTNATVKASSCGWLMLHAAYNLTLIRLNSSAAYPSHTSPIFSSSYSAMQRCLTAVENLKQLSRLAQASGLVDKVGPPFAFATWVAARVMLVHGSTMEHEIDPDIDFFVELLKEMGRYWDVAERYSSILSHVLEEYRSSRRPNAASKDIPSTVRILADMRRCAFDLDFLITRQSTNAVSSYQPTRTSSPLANELEYLDVFDLFNFPRMPIPHQGLEIPLPVSHTDQAPNLEIGNLTMPNFAVPNPQSDWLFHQT